MPDTLNILTQLSQQSYELASTISPILSSIRQVRNKEVKITSLLQS